MKKTLLTLLTCSLATFSFAGGLLTNTNQNVHFLRNPARDASTEIDAVYSNPAGLAFLKREGLHFSFNGQSAYQTRTITSNFAPFAGFGGNTTKTFKGEASAPFIPSLQAAYKKEKWVFSGSFAVTGGGGKATFNKGLASFEAPISTLPGYVNQIGTMLSAMMPEATLTADEYSVDAYMEGSQMIFGLQLGATYKVTDYLSVFGGLRTNYVKNGYVGHLRNIKINPESSVSQLNRGGELVSANEYFTQLEQAGLVPEQYQGMLDELVAATADKELECDQTGWGITPIIGANFNWEKLNVGVKYEFNTSLNVENKTKVDDTGMFADGVNTPHDIPALLTVGTSYEILPVLRMSLGYHHFFDKQAQMADNKQNYISHGTNEYIGGVEWDVLDWFQVSFGMQRSDYGLEDGYMSDLSYNVSSWTYGFGAGFKLAEDLKLNVAYFWTDYEDYTKASIDYNGTGIAGTDTFTRTNKVFGIGVDYRF